MKKITQEQFLEELKHAIHTEFRPDYGLLEDMYIQIATIEFTGFKFIAYCANIVGAINPFKENHDSFIAYDIKKLDFQVFNGRFPITTEEIIDLVVDFMKDNYKGDEIALPF